MKKIITLIMVLMMSLMLVACGEASTVTIKYETNGGNTITSTEIKLDDLKSFSLPEAPAKNGYIFIGWYLDSDFKEEFKSLDNVKKDITLYAKWEEQTLYTVSFSNGEETYTVSVKEGEKVLEPTAPTKEGYVFVGWYDGDNLFDFETIVTKDFVLTAKWQKEGTLDEIRSVSGKIELTNKLIISNNNSILEPDTFDAFLGFINNSKVTLELTVNNINTKNPKDIEAYLNCNLEIIYDETKKIECNIYVKNEIVYIETIDKTDLTPSSTYFQIDVEKIIKFFETLAKENTGTEGDLQEQNNEIIQEFQTKLTEILAVAAEYGLDTIFYNELVSLLKILKPIAVEEDNKIVYTVKNEQVQNFLTNLETFIEKYMVQLYKFRSYLNDIFYSDSDGSEEDDNVIDLGDYKAIKGENGWYDGEGLFHSFANDVFYLYGHVLAGYYVDYPFRCVYDINNNYTLVDAIYTNGYDIDTEKFYEAILLFTDKIDYFIYEDNDMIVKKPVSDDFSTQIFGYVYDGIYYIYHLNGAVYYNVETGKKLDPEEIIKIKANDMFSQVVFNIDTIKESLTINKFEVFIFKGLIDGLNGTFTINTDIDYNLSKEENYNIKEFLEFIILSDISLDNIAIKFPSFENYNDVTEILIAYFQSKLE